MHTHTSTKREWRPQEALNIKLLFEFWFPIFGTFQNHDIKNAFRKKDKAHHLI